jgi:hydroxyacylglutathione hydrolase
MPAYLPALTPDQFRHQQEKGMQIVDTRSPEAIAGALIPESIAIPLNMLPAYAGWFISYDRPIGLVMHTADEMDVAVRHLYRLGYDTISGYLASGLHEWETKGRQFQRIPALYAGTLAEKIENKEDFTLLDVRSEAEYERGHLPNALNLYVGNVPDRIDTIDRDRQVVTFCGSGRRAIVAASLLKAAGFEDVWNCFGSMEACSEIGCPMA